MTMIRCAADSAVESFQTSEQIPATLYVLYEYMQQHTSLGRRFSTTELESIKFRHRGLDKQRQDIQPLIPGLKRQWPAAWQIVFMKDEDRLPPEIASKQSKKKAGGPYTVFGYCSQFPVA
jgi:hypothetical protein